MTMKKNPALTAIITTILMAPPIFAQAADAGLVDAIQMRDIIIKTLKSHDPSQITTGTLTGKMANDMMQHTGSPGPITFTSKLLKSYNEEPDCGRIQQVFNIPSALMKDGSHQDGAITAQFNMCSNMRTPTTVPLPSPPPSERPEFQSATHTK